MKLKPIAVAFSAVVLSLSAATGMAAFDQYAGPQVRYGDENTTSWMAGEQIREARRTGTSIAATKERKSTRGLTTQRPGDSGPGAVDQVHPGTNMQHPGTSSAGGN